MKIKKRDRVIALLLSCAMLFGSVYNGEYRSYADTNENIVEENVTENIEKVSEGTDITPTEEVSEVIEVSVTEEPTPTVELIPTVTEVPTVVATIPTVEAKVTEGAGQDVTVTPTVEATTPTSEPTAEPTKGSDSKVTVTATATPTVEPTVTKGVSPTVTKGVSPTVVAKEEVDVVSANSLDEFAENLEDSMFDSKQLIVLSNTADFENYGAVEIQTYDNIYVLSYESSSATRSAYSKIKADKVVLSVEINEVLRVNTNSTSTESTIKETTEETELGKYLETLKATKEIRVAVLDTGLNTANFKGSYEDLGVDYTSEKATSLYDDNGHGTEMANLVVENSNSLVKVVPIKVADSTGKASVLNTYLAIQKAIESGVNVINISMSASASAISSVLTEAIDEANAKGIVVVVSAGNMGVSVENISPANVSSAVVVSAVNSDNSFASYSNYGSTVDYSSYGSYNGKTGTSYATARVSGLISDLLSKGGNVTTLDKYAIDLGTTGYDTSFGKGLLALETIKSSSEEDESNKLAEENKAKYENLCANWKGMTDEKLNKALTDISETLRGHFLLSLSEEELNKILTKDTILTETLDVYPAKVVNDYNEAMVIMEENSDKKASNVKHYDMGYKYYLELAENTLLTSAYSSSTGAFYIAFYKDSTLKGTMTINISGAAEPTTNNGTDDCSISVSGAIQSFKINDGSIILTQKGTDGTTKNGWSGPLFTGSFTQYAHTKIKDQESSDVKDQKQGRIGFFTPVSRDPNTLNPNGTDSLDRSLVHTDTTKSFTFECNSYNCGLSSGANNSTLNVYFNTPSITVNYKPGFTTDDYKTVSYTVKCGEDHDVCKFKTVYGVKSTDARPGYKFSHWEDQGGTTWSDTEVLDASKYSCKDKDVTLKAMWEKEKPPTNTPKPNSPTPKPNTPTPIPKYSLTINYYTCPSANDTDKGTLIKTDPNGVKYNKDQAFTVDANKYCPANYKYYKAWHVEGKSYLSSLSCKLVANTTINVIYVPITPVQTIEYYYANPSTGYDTFIAKEDFSAKQGELYTLSDATINKHNKTGYVLGSIEVDDARDNVENWVDITTKKSYTVLGASTVKVVYTPVDYNLTVDVKGGTYKSALADETTKNFDKTFNYGVETNFSSKDITNYIAGGISMPVKVGHHLGRGAAYGEPEPWTPTAGKVLDYPSARSTAGGSYAFDSSVTQDVTIVANWVPDTYTLTVNPDGGYMYNGDTYSTDVFTTNAIYGRKTYLGNLKSNGNYYSNYDLGLPKKTGYEFIGWKFSNGTGGLSTSGNVYFSDTNAYTSASEYAYNGDYAGDVTATAQWKPLSYKITVNPDGGSFFTPDSQTTSVTTPWSKSFTYDTAVCFAHNYELRCDTNLNAVSQPTKKGHRFTGWNITSGGGARTLSGIYWYFDGKYAGNVTITAQWEKYESTLQVHPNGGTWNGYTTTQTYTGKYNETKSIPDPTIPNYTATFNANGGTCSTASKTTNKAFSSWSVSNGTKPGGTLSNRVFTYGEHDGGSTSLTALWTGTYDITLPSPSRTGYTFNGWYTLPSGGTRVGGAGSTITISSNTTYYAQWTPITYKLTVNPDGGYMYNGDVYSTNIFTTNAVYGRKTYLGNLNPNNSYYSNLHLGLPSKTGHEFLDWKFDHGSGGALPSDERSGYIYFSDTVRYALQSEYAYNGDYAGDVIATAIYRIYRSTLHVNPNTGTWKGSTNTQSFTQDYNTTLAIPDPTKPNYTATFDATGGTCTSSIKTTVAFNGWEYSNPFNAGSLNTSTKVFTFGDKDNGEGTIKAKWTGSYSITLPTPTRPGWDFLGWYTAATGGTKVGNAGDKVTLSTNKTYYAQWTPHPTKITLSNTVDKSKVAFAKGNPVAVFLVTGKDVSGKPHTFVKTLKWDSNSNNYQSLSFTILSGTYTVTLLNQNEYSVGTPSGTSNVSANGVIATANMSNGSEATVNFTSNETDYSKYTGNSLVTTSLK